MTQFNKYKMSAKLSRKCSGEYIDNNNCNKTQNENDFKKKNIRQNKIFYRYKYISGINNKISRNNKINLDINISKDFKTEINNCQGDAPFGNLLSRGHSLIKEQIGKPINL